MIDVESSPFVLPRGYRLRSRFVLMPMLVAGRWRWCESVRVVQRFVGSGAFACHDDHWHDVGYWDEVAPSLGKMPTSAWAAEV